MIVYISALLGEYGKIETNLHEKQIKSYKILFMSDWSSCDYRVCFLFFHVATTPKRIEAHAEVISMSLKVCCATVALYASRLAETCANCPRTDSSVCKSRLVHWTKVNEFFSRQETRVRIRAPLRAGRAGNGVSRLATVSV